MGLSIFDLRGCWPLDGLFVVCCYFLFVCFSFNSLATLRRFAVVCWGSAPDPGCLSSSHTWRYHWWRCFLWLGVGSSLGSVLLWSKPSPFSSFFMGRVVSLISPNATTWIFQLKILYPLTPSMRLHECSKLQLLLIDHLATFLICHSCLSPKDFCPSQNLTTFSLGTASTSLPLALLLSLPLALLNSHFYRNDPMVTTMACVKYFVPGSVLTLYLHYHLIVIEHYEVVTLLSSFYTWENPGRERLRNLPQIVTLVSSKNPRVLQLAPLIKCASNFMHYISLASPPVFSTSVSDICSCLSGKASPNFRFLPLVSHSWIAYLFLPVLPLDSGDFLFPMWSVLVFSV